MDDILKPGELDDINPVGIPRKMCPVIFLLDTSGSMYGEPIGAVNEAIKNILPELISMNEENSDNEIKVAIMTFDYDAKWTVGETGLLTPEDVQNYWQDLDANGYTSMGEAFKSLNDKLSVSHGFMEHATGSVAPVLFLLSDGEPTDDYKSGLQELQKNPWYKIAIRVAVGYNDFNEHILREFTGNEGTVLSASDPDSLRKTIRFVAITSSRVASQGSRVDNTGNDDPDDNTGKLAQALPPKGSLNAQLDPGDGF
ncbi:MAG: VWA domain-containing protein [Selenomonadaceae bacterium]|nr:VWA domain-containing protein [Selenomonadaceae bacterium]